ncbi:hypothetical protein GMORB2_3822 [Geosmithia morbida]|uniref:Uncharacterized protein n=1 Tax=Geosmithia morbida TaxID=1094350 RepID=A0A9P5D2F1_9HYPO|nr:uncharacterized protein GMORB2_3822 [Geosmithia morbida]KAF4124983.1 hypothetical protein GMORB2_3822 [Geosmithia morbida]
MSTPEPRHDSALTRQRSRVSDDMAADGPDGDDGPTKGGHSLRRRARVNYATELIDDDVTVPSSTLAARQKRRRQEDALLDSPDDSHHPKARGSSLGVDTPSGRRRNPSRRLTENSKPDYFDGVDGDFGQHHDSDEEIHDTIQVGPWTSASPSSSSKSGSRNGSISHPSASSPLQNASRHVLDAKKAIAATTDADAGPKAGPEASIANGDNTHKTSTTRPKNDQPGEQSTDPSRQLQHESKESQQPAVSTSTPPAADAPADSSSLVRRSPDGGSRAPPTPPTNQDGKDTPHTHSPDPIHNGHKDSSAVAATNTTSLTTSSDNLPGVKSEHRSLSMPSAVEPKPSSTDAAEEGEPPKHPSAQLTALEKNSVDPSAESPAAQDASLTAETQTNDEPDDHKGSSSPRDTSMADTPASSPAKDCQSTPVESPTPAADAPNEVEPSKLASEPAVGTPLKEEVAVTRSEPVSDPRWSRPQPVPQGRWSHLTPYIDGEYTVYPERKTDEDDASEDQSPEEQESGKEATDADAPADDNDDGVDAPVTEAPTPALNTPTRGSPVPEAVETVLNSPAPAGEEPEEADVSDAQDDMERKKYYRYRKLRDPDEFVTAIENYEDMTTSELYDALQAINLSLVGWQDEWIELGKIVDDYENATRRRIADAKYETRTRNLHQHGINYEEPDFVVRGYKAKEREPMSETRYLQRQDRIMAATYGFEYDPHPSKIGRQNPEMQQAGVTTRGRALRNQPRQTVKATESDPNVVGKRQRKPVQPYDMAATHDNSRASSPVGRGARRRKTANQDSTNNDDVQASFASSFNDNHSDGEATGPGRRRRAGRPRASRGTGDDYLPSSNQANAQEETPRSSGRRGRPRASAKYDDQWSSSLDAEPKQQQQQQQQQQQGRHLLTLKLPKGQKFSQPSSITDNGDSRPSTASSDSTTETVESSYSLRPKRQKRFRDEPEDSPAPAVQPPPRKRNRRAGPAAGDGDEVMKTGAPTPATATPKAAATAAATTTTTATSATATTTPTAATQKSGGAGSASASSRKGHKIKIMRASAGPPAPQEPSRNNTPSSQLAPEGGDEPTKDYKAMTKSEKMSASMKNRWANGNMAGAVEKRKATLAAKKAAQVAADQRVGPIAPKPKAKQAKKETAPLPGENPAFIHSHHHQAPPLHPQPGPGGPPPGAHLHHQQPHRQQQVHHQQPHQPHPHAAPLPHHAPLHMGPVPHQQQQQQQQQQHIHQHHMHPHPHYAPPPPPPPPPPHPSQGMHGHGHPHAHAHPHHMAHQQHPHAHTPQHRPHTHPHHEYPGMGTYPTS